MSHVHDHQGGGHLAGEAEHGRVAHAAEDGRFSGTQRHAVGQNLRIIHGLDSLDSEIPNADGAAARQKHQIVFGDGLLQGAG